MYQMISNFGEVTILNLKKTLLISAATLGLFAAAQANINAQAASAKWQFNRTLTTAANTRNVTFTGSNALYNLPDGFKSAKVVAGRATLKKLASSKVSSVGNVRAYKVAKLNNGKVYYKVVTFNGKYRGWIYGGQSTSKFAGGIKSYNTFTSEKLTQSMANSYYELAQDPKVSQTIWTNPKDTQYQVGSRVMNSAPLNVYHDSMFKITAIGKRTREGDTWVKIQNFNSNSTGANGWILFDALELAKDQSPVQEDAIRIALVDSNNPSSVIKTIDYTVPGVAKYQLLGSYTNSNWNISDADAQAISKEINTALAGTGYSLTNSTLSAGQRSFLGPAAFGLQRVVKVPVSKN